MQNEEDVGRHILLERLAAGALLGVAGVYNQTARAPTRPLLPQPRLESGFPCLGQAMAKLNPAYSEPIGWFGKWHLSPRNENSASIAIRLPDRNLFWAGNPER